MPSRWPLSDIARLALAALMSVAAVAPGYAAAALPDAVVKAAFLYNFVKFAEWPALPAGAPISACVVGDDAVADALVDTVRGQMVSGRKIEVRRPADAGAWQTCQLLFIADGDVVRSAAGLREIRTWPVLTVSDSKGFAQTAGIVELFVEGGRMRFAINVATADASGLRLSSRLLGLARIVGGPHAN